MTRLQDDHQLVVAKRHRGQAIDQRQLAQNAEVRGAVGDRGGDRRAHVLFELHVDVGMRRAERGEGSRQKFHDRGDVREHAHVTARAACVPAHLVIELRRLPGGNTELLVHAPKVATHIEFSTWSRVESRPERPSIVPPSALTDRRWREPTSLTAADGRIEGGREVSKGDDVLARADEICHWTHAQFTYRFGVTGVRTTAAEALRGGVGVCQDYAHVMIARCRSVGIAARYASGHLVGEGGSHAWVEVVAPHRGEAFAACQFVIDEMKKTVPIWKKPTA